MDVSIDVFTDVFTDVSMDVSIHLSTYVSTDLSIDVHVHLISRFDVGRQPEKIVSHCSVASRAVLWYTISTKYARILYIGD